MILGSRKGYSQTIGRYSSYLPHDLSTFSAPFPLHISGEGAEKVRKWCGDRAENPFFIPWVSPQVFRLIQKQSQWG